MLELLQVSIINGVIGAFGATVTLFVYYAVKGV